MHSWILEGTASTPCRGPLFYLAIRAGSAIPIVDFEVVPRERGVLTTGKERSSGEEDAENTSEEARNFEKIRQAANSTRMSERFWCPAWVAGGRQDEIVGGAVTYDLSSSAQAPTSRLFPRLLRMTAALKRFGTLEMYFRVTARQLLWTW